ncbi:hypothetical protein [Streptomyces neyagawaensis]|uniref:Uncharacterized protein n=1 Tax=Streptomyces neyagawaensis TaxID=42238 RepID=A0ABV3B8I4_9ACTN
MPHVPSGTDGSLPVTAQVARSVAARGPYPLAMRVRDELGELFADAEFADAFGAWGRPGWSPGQLALVTVPQFASSTFSPLSRST